MTAWTLYRVLRGTVSLLVALPLAACSPPEPTTYDDCILRHMNAGMDRTVSQALMVACRNKFQEFATPQKQYAQLPLEAASKLGGWIDVADGRAEGRIYNGNDDWVIREVTLYVQKEPIILGEKNPDAMDLSGLDALLPKGQFLFFLDLKKIARHEGKNAGDSAPPTARYRVTLTVPPLSSREFSVGVNVNAPTFFKWSITEATGTRIGN